jgi:hypothetical protein
VHAHDGDSVGAAPDTSSKTAAVCLSVEANGVGIDAGHSGPERTECINILIRVVLDADDRGLAR